MGGKKIDPAGLTGPVPASARALQKSRYTFGRAHLYNRIHRPEINAEVEARCAYNRF
jgi:hypothetical protein